MFVIFLGGVLAFAVIAILIAYIWNKVYLRMLKDEEKIKREIEEEKKENKN